MRWYMVPIVSSNDTASDGDHLVVAARNSEEANTKALHMLASYVDVSPDVELITTDYDDEPEDVGSKTKQKEHLTVAEAIKRFKLAIDASPRNGYVTEFYLQAIKYADVLKSLTGREFAQQIKLGTGMGTEFSKARNLAERLKKAGLNLSEL